MAAHVVPLVRIQADDFDAAAEIAQADARTRDVGAVVTFTGLCRDEGGRARGAGTRTLSRHGGGRNRAHRGRGRRALAAATGSPPSTATAISQPGDNIVLVVAASAIAMRLSRPRLPDGLSEVRAPFWKKEHPKDGGDGGWVDAREDDEIAARRWERG